MTNRYYNNSFTAALGSRALSAAITAQLNSITTGLTQVQAEMDAMRQYGNITGLTGFPSSFAGMGLRRLRVNAAESAVEFAHNIPIISVTSSRNLAASDIGGLVVCNSASAVTLTVQPVASVPIDVESPVMVCQYGAGKVTMAAGAGVTLLSNGGFLSTNGQYAVITLIQITTNTWLVGGDRGY